ncbi:MAG TPA: RNA methyltransferase [Thermoanaerobaculia bacterium]|nr:RNA methyltransferase [Thermoanaerobaculia bacterium]
MSLSLVATCGLGLEEILAGELSALGFAEVEPQQGAVAFAGGWREVWRANLWLRTANRVLVALATFPAGTGDALARGAGELVRSRQDWAGVKAADLFHPDRSFAVVATTRASRINDVRWAALKTKDGIADAQRAQWGRRGTIDKANPQLPLRVLIVRDQATLLVDTSGEPLDHRGYRVAGGEAPVREQIAAACVLASGWDGRGPVVDPMCGTGTLLAEAGWWAAGRAPGNLRALEGWAFSGLPGFDPKAFQALLAEPPAAPAPDFRLFGVDSSPEALAAARRNLTKAGLVNRLILQRGDAFEYQPPEGPGLILVNPPWGSHLAEPEDLWRRLGDLLKQRYKGWRAVVLAGDEGRGKWIGLKPKRRVPVRIGPVEARILVFELY